jgi:hypothetical protein
MRRWTIAALMALATALPAAAGSMSLSWDPVPGAAGYRVYSGPSSAQYTRVVDVGNQTSYTLTGVPNCADAFVAVKAYNSQRQESQGFSNEVSGWPRPAFSAMADATPMQGQQFTLGITGSNFRPGSALIFDTDSVPHDIDDNPLLRIESADVVACDRIEALVTVESAARGFRAMAVGDFALGLEVRNPDAVYGVGTRMIDVQYNPERADVNRSDQSTRDRVDGKDLVWLAHAYATTEGETYFNPDADLNGDGQVDGVDLSLLASAFGRCWSGSGWSGSACP